MGGTIDAMVDSTMRVSAKSIRMQCHLADSTVRRKLQYVSGKLDGMV